MLSLSNLLQGNSLQGNLLPNDSLTSNSLQQNLLPSNILPGNVLLAPMAGVTDLPFRKTVRKFGNFLMYSEMIASQAVIREVKRTLKMMNHDNDQFTAVQLVGADPNVMAEAAKLGYNLGAKILDINMGCPVKKVVKTDSGSALMKDLKLAAKIIEAVVKAVPIPVTLKTRLGWDNEHLNVAELAHIAENSGIQMVTVHGRTRAQLYSGKADWKAVSNVKSAVKIPVIVNGDIVSVESAKLALEQSNADGVMIGRGSLGAPWLLKEIHDNLAGIKHNQITAEQKYNVAKEHIQSVLEFYPERINMILAKKVTMYYSKHCFCATKFRSIMSNSSITEPQALFNILHDMIVNQ